MRRPLLIALAVADPMFVVALRQRCRTVNSELRARNGPVAGLDEPRLGGAP